MFDPKRTEKAVVAWANKAIAAHAKKNEGMPFRRAAFDFDAQGTLFLAADRGKAKRPGDYSDAQLASFESAPKGGDLLDELCGQRAAAALDVLVAAAKQLDVGALARTADFKVVVFDHDEDEVQASKRMNGAAPKRR